jgi:uncharacterized protein (TIGR04255 family)
MLSAPRLDDVLERFDAERVFAMPAFKFEQVDPNQIRFQVVKGDGERMLQVQDTRFVYNWRRRGDSPYPSYDQLRPEFDEQLHSFERFLGEANISAPTLNQWEVVYVNFIPRGELWNSPNDWSAIFTGLSLPGGAPLDTFSGAWSSVIEGQRGRLHIELRHAQNRETSEEVIRLQLTARGPLSRMDDLPDLFEVGHKAIVTTFANMTSKRAHEHWGRRT